MSHGEANGSGPLLDVQHLSVDFRLASGPVRVVDDVSFTLNRGDALGIVGESGSGKSTTVLALLRLLPANAEIVGGRVLLGGTDLLDLPERQLRDIRWRKAAIVFQSAMNALNPVRTIGSQISEPLRVHEPEKSSRWVGQRTHDLLEMVGIGANRIDAYPHQLSGGMRQRATIAMALACGPDLLITDEPTTAIDVMIQAQILDLLRSLRERLGMSLILVSHDLGAVVEVCDRVLVMYAGRIVEDVARSDLVPQAAHPYSRLLLDSSPDLRFPGRRLASIPGTPPRLGEITSGCTFASRCPAVFERCRLEAPPLFQAGSHRVACFLQEPATSGLTHGPE